MGQYKVIQDIEAEDKLVGPLGLRQFIYAAVTVSLLFVMYRLSLVSILLALPFLPPAAFFGLLAVPFGKDQSSEVWLLAKISFFLKPGVRIWDQSGAKDLVTITAPKKIEKELTDHLTQSEVKSRLKALSDTIDTRGWAIKNVNVNLSMQPSSSYQPTIVETDRLVTGADQMVGQKAAGFKALADEVQPSDDILDAQHNQAAQQLDKMMNAAAQTRREQLVANMHEGNSTSTPAQGSGVRPDYWFLRGEEGPPSRRARVVSPGSETGSSTTNDVDDAQAASLLEALHKKTEANKAAYGHMRTIQPLGDADATQPPQAPSTGSNASSQGQPVAADKSPEPPEPKEVDPAIIQLANNDDRSVESIAREAKQIQEKSEGELNGDGEVVISLH